MIEKLFHEFSRLNEVEAIALGGSRAGIHYDENSDYDVYVYCTSHISENVRRTILTPYCRSMEIGNHYWEYEDNCQLNNGVELDILYRNLNAFTDSLAQVVELHQAHNGYTTCMWHNLNTCQIIYDANDRLTQIKKRFNVPYPEQLKDNIINRNLNLLSEAMPNYSHQIQKAVSRNDKISILHRTTAFLESYFDILFALNKLTHPGEKRLIELCKSNCSILPQNFEENLNLLFQNLYAHPEKISNSIDVIIIELKRIIDHIK